MQQMIISSLFWDESCAYKQPNNYIYTWVCLKMRSAAREVWLGGMIRGYDSGYGSGYGSGVWFAALYVPILSPKIPKTSECC